jgi:hypothetical protein
MTLQRSRSMGLVILLASVLISPQKLYPATAVDVSLLLDQAKIAAAQEDYDRAIEALQTALEQVRMAAPLTAKSFLLVTEPAKFYGDYKPRKDAVFRRGEPIHVYLEPKNLVYSRTDQGLYEPAFSIDLQILSTDGEVLANQERFGFFRFSSKSPLQDIFVNLHVTLTGAQAGSYQIRFIVHDANSQKTATATQPITLK